MTSPPDFSTLPLKETLNSRFNNHDRLPLKPMMTVSRRTFIRTRVLFDRAICYIGGECEKEAP